MRQAGLLAAAASYALDHNRHRMHEDHTRARAFASKIAEIPGLTLDADRVQTNMLYFTVDPSLGTAREFCERLDDRVRMLDEGPQSVRAVVHLHITDEDIDRAADELAAAACSQSVSA